MSAARHPIQAGRIQALVSQILGPDGRAQQAGYSHKPQQLEYAQKIAEGLERGDANALLASVLAVSADTGLGKTLGYCVPLLAYAGQGRRVAIATNSLSLQAQILGTQDKPGDVRKVAGWLNEQGAQVRVARRMGRQAFISADAVSRTMRLAEKHRGLNKAERIAMEELLDFAKAANDATDEGYEENTGLIEAAIERFGGALPLNLLPAQVCINSDSPKEDLASYRKHIQKTHDANVVLMTHQYLAVNTKFYGGFFHEETAFDALIVDEADCLADAAELVFRDDLSLYRLRSALEGSPVAKKALESVDEMIELLANSYSGGEALAVSMLQGDVLIRLKALASECSGRLQEVYRAAKVVIDDLHDNIWREQINEASTVLGVFSSPDTPKDGVVSAVSFSPVKALPSLSMMPLYPGRILRRLWSTRVLAETNEVRASPLRMVCFTSATLAAPGADAVKGFRDMAVHLGIDREDRDPKRQNVEIDLWASFAPTKFGEVKFIFADPALENPLCRVDDAEEDVHQVVPTQEWLDYTALMVAKAHQAGGKTLVLTRSYTDTAAIASLLEEKGLSIIQHVRGNSMKEMKAQYIGTPKAIWLTPAGWAGLDLPGNVQNLVITRLPFQPSDPVYRALLEDMLSITPERATGIMYGERMNACKRLFAQALGRGIRHEDDNCRIWIADPRLPLPKDASVHKKLRHMPVSRVKRWPALLECVPKRFRIMLSVASVLSMGGELVK